MVAYRRRAKIAFWVGACLFTASLSWLVTNISKLVYGVVAPYEVFIPGTVFVIGMFLVVLFHKEAM